MALDTASYRQVTTDAANRLADGCASEAVRSMIAAQITHNVNALCDEVDRLRGLVSEWDAQAQALNLRLHDQAFLNGRLEQSVRMALGAIKAKQHAQAKRILSIGLKAD